ncbi:hypothetical protein OOU_Y34scaffold00527g2 [Pyricularia oryzae Y34]|uniref:Uncharacterized protein n=2 Tax=Pyricularia oryzae TaxID=318829 RepID=A0AA97NYP5_PYRO3|nr:hypothetical protein OOU_Y34scaffold00527g2 [Pyricularia oryzae Y34]
MCCYCSYLLGGRAQNVTLNQASKLEIVEVERLENEGLE